MKSLAEFESENGRVVICDFICPTEDLRQSFNADFSIWMDTVKTSNYKDTDSIFQPPDDYDLRFRKWDQYSPKEIAKLISRCLILKNLLFYFLVDGSLGMMDICSL